MPKSSQKIETAAAAPTAAMSPKTDLEGQPNSKIARRTETAAAAPTPAAVSEPAAAAPTPGAVAEPVGSGHPHASPLRQMPNLAVVDGSSSAGPVMLELVPFVEQSLIKLMGTAAGFQQFSGGAPLHKHQPLAIIKGETDTMVSYKAPWEPASCKIAVTTTSMYEAGGNLFWVNWRAPTGKNAVIAGSAPRWAQVQEVADRYFCEAAQVGILRRRIVFPTTLLVHASSLDTVINASDFADSLEMLVGHLWVWGWVYGVHKAMQQNNVVLVRMLWEAALTVTLHLKTGMTDAAKAATTIAESELRKAQDRLMSDSFVAFAGKCWVIIDEDEKSPNKSKMQLLNDRNCTYGGSAVTKGMLSTISYFRDRFDANAIEVMLDIEFKFGRDVLTGAASKLSRLGAIAGASTMDGLKDGGPTAAQAVNQFLEYIRFAMTYEYIQPKDVTAEYMDKAKDGTPGAIVTALGRHQVVALVSAWAEDLRESTQSGGLYKELAQVIPMFESYPAYANAFPTTKSNACTAELGDGDGEAALAEPQGTQEDGVSSVKRKFKNPATHAAIDFLYDLLSGIHDKAIKDAVMKATSLHGAKWTETDGMSALRDLFRLLTAHRGMVQIGDGPPPPESRVLKRYRSQGGEDDERCAALNKERQDTWRQVTALRKKFCSLGVCKGNTAQEFQKMFERTDAYKTTSLLKPAEAHRLFIFSADLWTECPAEPWKNPPRWNPSAEGAMKFIVSQVGPADILLFCDGRSRACRLQIEKLAGHARNLSEIFLIYTPSFRLGRRVAWSGTNCEMMLASFPVDPTKLVSKGRSGDFTVVGENSTHDNTYSGVNAVPWAGLPLLSLGDKARAMGVQETLLEVPNTNLFDSSGGVPLYWQERKPVQLWRQVFEDLQARTVVDLSPGGGLAARAAMELGISYLGLARTAEQCSWLANVCDRAAARAAVTSSTSLFNQDLKTSLEEHFGDILEHGRVADAALDKQEPVDDEEDLA